MVAVGAFVSARGGVEGTGCSHFEKTGEMYGSYPGYSCLALLIYAAFIAPYLYVDSVIAHGISGNGRGNGCTTRHSPTGRRILRSSHVLT